VATEFKIPRHQLPLLNGLPAYMVLPLQPTKPVHILVADARSGKLASGQIFSLINTNIERGTFPAVLGRVTYFGRSPILMTSAGLRFLITSIRRTGKWCPFQPDAFRPDNHTRRYLINSSKLQGVYTEVKPGLPPILMITILYGLAAGLPGRAASMMGSWPSQPPLLPLEARYSNNYRDRFKELIF